MTDKLQAAWLANHFRLPGWLAADHKWQFAGEVMEGMRELGWSCKLDVSYNAHAVFEKSVDKHLSVETDPIDAIIHAAYSALNSDSNERK
jgi:hypothetical protein